MVFRHYCLRKSLQLAGIVSPSYMPPPRLLFVGVNIGPFAFACVSAHATRHSSKEFTEWWSLFRNVHSQVSRMYSHIVGGADLNTVFDRLHTNEMHIGGLTSGRAVPSKFSEGIARDINNANLRLASSMELYCKPSYIGNPFTYISIGAFGSQFAYGSGAGCA